MKQYPEELEARIAAYIDGELSPAEAARLEVFLANTDPALAEQVIGMIAEKHAVKSLPREKAPEDLAARVMEQVERTTLLSDVEHFSAPRRPWWQGRLAIAAGLLLIVGGFTYFIAQALIRPDTPWRDAMMEPAQPRPLAKTTATAEATAPAAGQLASAKRSLRPAQPAGSRPSHGTVSATQLASAAPASSPEPAKALKFGALAEPTPSASGRPGTTRPLTLTLLARNASEYERMRVLLTEWSGQAHATNAPAALAGMPASEASIAARSRQQSPSTQPQPLSAGTAQSAPQARSATAEERETTTAPAADQIAGRGPQRFSLKLRPDQLAMLTHDFQVQKISREANALGSSLAPATTQNAPAAEGTNQSATPSAPLANHGDATSIPCVVTIVRPPQARNEHPTTAPAEQ